MIKFLRKFVFVIVVMAFLLASANVPLLIHLAEHKGDAHHDHDKCPICQQAIANKTKAIIPIIITAVQLPQITIANVNVIECFVKEFEFITPYLRASPSAA